MVKKKMLAVLLFGIFVPFLDANPSSSENDLATFIHNAESEMDKMWTETYFVYWDYEVNITEESQEKRLKQKEKLDAMTLRLGNEAQKFLNLTIKDYDLQRKFKKLSDIGPAILPKKKLKRYNHLSNEMKTIYSTAKVPDYNNRTVLLKLNPDISNRMAKSRDPEELTYYWNAWREATGNKMRQMFPEVVNLTNDYAKLNGHIDGTASKTSEYESNTFVSEMEETWNGLKPLYQELHAYVRDKLVKQYGEDIVPRDGPIPAHLLGNMWAQSWSNLNDILKPYLLKPNLDVTKEMVKQGWTPKTMFTKADQFFQSMGLRPMPKEFWEDSILERPKDDRDMVCHASAWDFFNGKDRRIKQCTVVDQDNFITANHEMGHIHYHMAYENQSLLYRVGANPGFHEAVADILSIAVGTAGYSKRLGLISEDVDITDKETEMNVLFDMALKKLVFLPFGYLVDKFRWDLYSDKVKDQDINCHWVKLRLDVQGVSPPSKRSEDNFDAGSKYHVAANAGYVRYFTAHIYQFQFYKAMCEVSGQYLPGDPSKPLHRCNFYGSKEAGAKLFSMLKLGASKPWKEVIETLTGTSKMDVAAYREYFQPLETWLKEENKRNGVEAGWKIGNYKSYCEKAE